MISGRETLSTIGRYQREARGELDQSVREAERLKRRIETLQQKEIGLYRELAKLRLEAIVAGEVIDRLTRAERQALAAVEARETRIETMAAALETQAQEIGAKREAREALADDVARQQEELDAALAALQRRLEADPQYKAVLDQAQRAGQVAQHALEKVQQAEEDREEKGAPYEASKLFMYLWQRRYGTGEYRAFPLFKALDGWVAGLCDYQSARPNYFMLQEIPTRLRAHADRLTQKAEVTAQAVEAYEAKAEARDGALKIRDSVERLEGQLGGLDAEITELEEAFARQERGLAALRLGEDETSDRAIRELAEALRDRSIRELRRSAAQTPGGRDDALVMEIDDIEEDIDDLEDDLEDLEDRVKRDRRRIDELGRIEGGFRRRRYDAPESLFDNEGVVALLLKEVLRGALTADVFWDRLGRQHRTTPRRRRPDFGSRSLPRRRGSVWGTSSSSRSPTKPRLPRVGRAKIGRGRRGGFRTGGRF